MHLVPNSQKNSRLFEFISFIIHLFNQNVSKRSSILIFRLKFFTQTPSKWDGATAVGGKVGARLLVLARAQLAEPRQQGAGALVGRGLRIRAAHRRSDPARADGDGCHLEKISTIFFCIYIFNFLIEFLLYFSFFVFFKNFGFMSTFLIYFS
jgi:hypothetical protein